LGLGGGLGGKLRRGRLRSGGLGGEVRGRFRGSVGGWERVRVLGRE